jgi:putative transcriptional regulator
LHEVHESGAALDVFGMLYIMSGISYFSPMKSRYEVENSVRRHRRIQDLTQQELALRAGVTRQTILAVEKGRFTPSVGLALRLAELLGVTVEDLFRRGDGG